MSLKLFITGTDTNVGKTYISIGLIKKFNQSGLKTLGIKPVSTGGYCYNGKVYNEDAIQLQQYSTATLHYKRINPISLLRPVSPNIAAQFSNIPISVNTIMTKMQFALNSKAEVFVIEGIGGWLTPLNNIETMADLVNELKLSVILVVGVRTGCLNHALLTMQSIRNSQTNLVGWIANCIDPNTEAIPENVFTLQIIYLPLYLVL